VRAVRATAFLAGLAAAVAIVLTGRPAGARYVTGVGLSVTVNRTGELGVSPAGELVSGRYLAPGGTADDAAGAAFTLRNQTGATRGVRISVAEVDPALGAALSVRIYARGRSWFEGPLRELAAGTRAALVLAPAQSRRVAVRVWLRRERDAPYQGHTADLRLELHSRAVGRHR
jgi:hypothetical protein